LHFLLDRPDLFKKILKTIDYIPENIPDMAKKTGNTQILEIISYEKLLNRQLKYINDVKIVTSFLADKDIDVDLFMEDLKQKFNMIRTVSIDLKHHLFNSTIVA
ncbi:MAG: hypothetical protein U9R50_08800, partial [Campylobacterota bacterium]|nr:hypothetical protein [Campylobacterota bacterium]